jgi:hypothetical protein
MMNILHCSFLSPISRVGQHWCDFVYKGVVANNPAYCLTVKNQFNKCPDFAYSGKKRKEAVCAKCDEQNARDFFIVLLVR